MERCFAKFSTQWKHVSGTFPHNGSMFRALFHTMETCFAAGFHGVENGWEWGLNGGGGMGRMGNVRSEEPDVERVAETPEVPEAVAAARNVRRIIVPWGALAAWMGMMAFLVGWLLAARAGVFGLEVDIFWWESLVRLTIWVPPWLMPVMVLSSRGVLVVRGFGLWRRRVAWEEVRHVMVTKFGGIPSASLMVKTGKPLGLGLDFLEFRKWRRCERLWQERGVQVRRVAMRSFWSG